MLFARSSIFVITFPRTQASEDDLHIERHEFYFDKNVSNPLMWRPLYFGGLGFAQRHYHGNVCVLA